MLSCFHLIPERIGQTDRQTDLLYQYRASVCWRAIKKLSGNFGYMGRSNPLRDLDQMWHVGRYGGRNHVCNIFRDCRLRGVDVVREVSLPFTIDSRCHPYNTGHTTVWPCDRRAFPHHATKFCQNQATRCGVMTSDTISRWRQRWLNTTYGFVFDDVTLIRRSKSIRKGNFVNIS